jgi:hypothetical protein
MRFIDFIGSLFKGTAEVTTTSLTVEGTPAL